jgi:hypothetical protein
MFLQRATACPNKPAQDSGVPHVRVHLPLGLHESAQARPTVLRVPLLHDPQLGPLQPSAGGHLPCTVLLDHVTASQEFPVHFEGVAKDMLDLVAVLAYR